MTASVAIITGMLEAQGTPSPVFESITWIGTELSRLNACRKRLFNLTLQILLYRLLKQTFGQSI